MAKALGGLKRGLVFVVSAPAGTGKTTLVRMLCKEFDCVVESISFTTRKPRVGEAEGGDYHFITQGEFERKIQEGEFLEFAKVFENYYGTSRLLVESHRARGQHVVLVIDTQGAMQLMESFDAIFIFLRPPSLAELRKRLIARSSETEESLARRLAWAEREIPLAGRYDYQIVNDQIDTAYEVLRSILIAEEHKNR